MSEGSRIKGLRDAEVLRNDGESLPGSTQDTHIGEYGTDEYMWYRLYSTRNISVSMGTYGILLLYPLYP